MEITSQPNVIDDAQKATNTLSAGYSPEDSQASVNDHFEVAASDWERIYSDKTLRGRIYQDRLAITLQWIAQLHLGSAAHLLEVGCGAGFATAALAKQGYCVDAVDSVPTMLDITSKRLGETGAAERVRIVHADVRRLPMPNDSFDLVFALGVLPWLDDPLAAVREMARVTRPGGYVLVTADNSIHLEEILDPVRLPILKPVRRYVASALRRAKLLSPPRSPEIHRHSPREVDSMLSAVGLGKLQSVMLGFGPFTLCRQSLLSNTLGIKVHGLLQAAAHRNLPIVSSYGMQYLALSTRRARVQ